MVVPAGQVARLLPARAINSSMQAAALSLWTLHPSASHAFLLLPSSSPMSSTLFPPVIGHVLAPIYLCGLWTASFVIKRPIGHCRRCTTSSFNTSSFPSSLTVFPPAVGHVFGSVYLLNPRTPFLVVSLPCRLLLVAHYTVIVCKCRQCRQHHSHSP